MSMFGNRNYSRYSFNANSSEPLSLGDSVKVNKLKDSQLSVYFNVLKNASTSRQELAKRNNHFEEFKRVCNTKRIEKMVKKNTIVNSKKDSIGEMLRRYGVRPVKENIVKPAMRRAPLRGIKTVGIEIPSVYKAEAIYQPPKKRDVEMFVEITKPIARDKPKVQINEIPEIKEHEPPPKSVIEQQLKITRDEINMANIQLEHIRSLLGPNKGLLSPLKEEDEIEQKVCQAKEFVDKKSSPIQPRTQWTVRALDHGRSNKTKKNKLVTTLNSLNDRLQKIQEKYFNEPKFKYKSISDFPSPKRTSGVETLYTNTVYEKDSAGLIHYDDEPEDFDSNPTEYMRELIKRTQKLTKINKKPTRKGKTNDSILVVMQPKEEISKDSDPQILLDTSHSSKTNRGILKKRTPSSTETSNMVLEAPKLQESISKSNYLMREFKLGSNDKDFDLGKLLVNDKEDYRSSESIRKNVKFSKNPKKSDSRTASRLNSNIDLALKNSLFYYGQS